MAAQPRARSDRHVHKVKLSDFKAKKADEGALDIELDDGETIRIPPVELWHDEVIELSEGGHQVDAARLLLGDENYAKFVASGGTALLLSAIVEEMHGATVGESPASPAS